MGGTGWMVVAFFGWVASVGSARCLETVEAYKSDVGQFYRPARFLLTGVMWASGIASLALAYAAGAQ